MNKNILIGGLILVLAGTAIYFTTRDTETSPTATSTRVVVDANTQPNTPPTQTTPSLQATAPVATTNSTVSPSDTASVVNGTVNPKGALTNYWYEYSTASNMFENKTPTQTMGSGFVTIQAPGYIINLAKNTTYYFRLVAENQYGRVNGVQSSFKTTAGNPTSVGSAPTVKTLSVNNVSRTTINLNGEITPNKVTTNYWFEYGKSTQLGNTSALSSAGDGSAKIAVSIALTDLEPATTYYFRVNAQNQFGTVNGSILNVKTAGPAAPTVPQVETKDATGISNSAASLHGTVNPNGAETRYWFEYSTDSLLGSVLLTTTAQMTLNASIDDTSVKTDISGLKSKTTYYFRLVGQNSQGTIRGNSQTFKTR